MSKQIISCVNPRWIVNPAIEELCHAHILYQADGVSRIPPYYEPKKYFRRMIRGIEHPENWYFFSRGLRIPIYVQVSCGDCYCCNETRRQDIAQRIELEMCSHQYPPYWCTLTFDDDNVRDNELHYRDYQLFMKRLRERFTQSIRFFAVGEHGTSTKRQHWHCFLFGLETKNIAEQVKNIETINLSWGNGFTFIRLLDSIQGQTKYVTKYVTKRSEFIQRWSKGLGCETVKKYSSYFYKANANTQPQYLNYYGQPKKMRVNSWVLDTVFGNMSRETYEVRVLLRKFLQKHSFSEFPQFIRQKFEHLNITDYCPKEKFDYIEPDIYEKIVTKLNNLDWRFLYGGKYSRAAYTARFDNTLTSELVQQRETQYKDNHFRRKSFEIL